MNPGEVIYTRIWEENGVGLENGFRKLHFAATEHMSGRPVLTGIRAILKYLEPAFNY